MIAPIKSNAFLLIDIGKEKINGSEKSASNSPDANYIDKTSTVKSFHFVSYQKRSQDFYEPLIRFVDNLVTQQSEISKKIADNNSQNEIDKLEKTDFETGTNVAEKSAEKIVDFAKRLSGEDKSKVGQLKNAVKQGFIQAEKNIGRLPEAAQKTLENVLNKIDAWYNNK